MFSHVNKAPPLLVAIITVFSRAGCASRGRGFINNRPTLWNPARRQCNTGLSSCASMCAVLALAVLALADDKRRVEKRRLDSIVEIGNSLVWIPWGFCSGDF